MAVTAKAYGRAGLSLMNKEMDLDTDAIKVMLCTATYTPDQDAHRYKSDVTNEVSGTGYTAGGATLASPAVSYTGATNVAAFDAADTVWGPPAVFTARYAVVYDGTPGTDATRPLLGWVDFGADVVVSTTLTITWAAGGIATITAT